VDPKTNLKADLKTGLANRTNLTPTQIADLLNFVLRSTYFQYDGSIYEQKDGAAMGSPVSAVFANLYMEEFEERAIATATNTPKIWERYVDDTFTVLGKDYVDHNFISTKCCGNVPFVSRFSVFRRWAMLVYWRWYNPNVLLPGFRAYNFLGTKAGGPLTRWAYNQDLQKTVLCSWLSKKLEYWLI